MRFVSISILFATVACNGPLVEVKDPTITTNVGDVQVNANADVKANGTINQTGSTPGKTDPKGSGTPPSQPTSPDLPAATTPPQSTQPVPSTGDASTALAPAGGDFMKQIAQLSAFGTLDGMEIGTWNIENYPKTSESRSVVSGVLNKLDVDIMAVQEIANTTVFTSLISEMPGFSGVIAGQDGGQKSQNSALIYRTADFRLVSKEDLFRGENDAFPRPPLMVRLDPIKEGRSDIVAIVVHLKAFGDDDSSQRRAIANVKLEQYVSQLLANEPSLQIVVLGDFNQPLLNNIEREVFRPWFDRADKYTIRTEANVRKNDYSFFGGQRFNFTDHIIASNNFTVSEPIVPKLQTTISNFEMHASDHLPVLVKFY